MNEDVSRYSDIIDLPHHVSYKHAHMSDMERAAQFSPFEALTGYDEKVRETEAAIAAEDSFLSE